MANIKTFRQIALAFPDTKEEPHFDSTSFRFKKKIFASLNEQSQIACLKFSASEQELFCSIHPKSVYPVDNYWGKHGWTYLDIRKLKKELLTDTLAAAYRGVTQAKVGKKK